MIEHAVFSTLVSIVMAYSAYCIVEYFVGATPAQRARGLERLVDLISTSVAVLILYVIYMRLPQMLHVIGEAIGVNVPVQDVNLLTSMSEGYFRRLFDELVNFQRILFLLVTALGTVPYTVPISVYVSHSTQYLQWMMHWALINVGMYRILGYIATFSRDLMMIGLILSIPTQTRPLGSTLCGLSIALPSLTILTWRWCLCIHIDSLIPNKLSLNDVINAAKTIVLGGYELGAKLQELNMMLDLALGLALAAAYSIGRIVDKTTHLIHMR